jgi:sensor histidine kinase regulating citrate/malate metabolism
LGVPEKIALVSQDLGIDLGLPMVNKFVLKSGGELRFQSEEGQGTVFSMAFPPKDFP